jgi:DNA repair exonuclease SbcCD ATPase subunit
VHSDLESLKSLINVGTQTYKGPEQEAREVERKVAKGMGYEVPTWVETLMNYGSKAGINVDQMLIKNRLKQVKNLQDGQLKSVEHIKESLKGRAGEYVSPPQLTEGAMKRHIQAVPPTDKGLEYQLYELKDIAWIGIAKYDLQEKGLAEYQNRISQIDTELKDLAKNPTDASPAQMKMLLDNKRVITKDYNTLAQAHNDYAGQLSQVKSKIENVQARVVRKQIAISKTEGFLLEMNKELDTLNDYVKDSKDKDNLNRLMERNAKILTYTKGWSQGINKLDESAFRTMERMDTWTTYHNGTGRPYLNQMLQSKTAGSHFDKKSVDGLLDLLTGS